MTAERDDTSSPPAPKRLGRPSIFPGKTGRRIHCDLTPEGRAAFDKARQELADRVGWKVESVSDSDTAEFLALQHQDPCIDLMTSPVTGKK